MSWIYQQSNYKKRFRVFSQNWKRIFNALNDKLYCVKCNERMLYLMDWYISQNYIKSKCIPCKNLRYSEKCKFMQSLETTELPMMLCLRCGNAICMVCISAHPINREQFTLQLNIEEAKSSLENDDDDEKEENNDFDM